MTFYKMHRRIVRFVSTQKKFTSRSTAENDHDMVLYNEKPPKSKSLIVRGDAYNIDHKEGNESEELKSIRASHSNIFFLLNKNLVVLYNGSEKVPVLEEGAINEIPTIRLIGLLRWFAKSKDSDVKSPVQPGGRIGRLDAANEAGFFHRTDRSRLKEIKKKLKNKGEEEPTEPKKAE